MDTNAWIKHLMEDVRGLGRRIDENTERLNKKIDGVAQQCSETREAVASVQGQVTELSRRVNQANMSVINNNDNRAAGGDNVGDAAANSKPTNPPISSIRLILGACIAGVVAFVVLLGAAWGTGLISFPGSESEGPQPTLAPPLDPLEPPPTPNTPPNG